MIDNEITKNEQETVEQETITEMTVTLKTDSDYYKLIANHLSIIEILLAISIALTIFLKIFSRR